MKHKWVWVLLLVAMLAGISACYRPYGHRGYYYSDYYHHGRSYHHHSHHYDHRNYW